MFSYSSYYALYAKFQPNKHDGNYVFEKKCQNAIATCWNISYILSVYLDNYYNWFLNPKIVSKIKENK